MDVASLRKLYGHLKGMEQVTLTEQWVTAELVADYNRVIALVASETGEDLRHLESSVDVRYEDDGRQMCQSKFPKEKLSQAIGYLEYACNLGSATIEIGSIYNSIEDGELRSRCSDLLSAPGNFDRVVNQATQVLESRIRKTTGAASSQTGTQLVNTYFQTDVSKTPFILSDDPDEHEGFCHVLRGVMLAYRNPSHHSTTTKYTREDALIVCSFIDILLRTTEKARKR